MAADVAAHAGSIGASRKLDSDWDGSTKWWNKNYLLLKACACHLCLYCSRSCRALFFSKNDGDLPRSIRFADLFSTLIKIGFSAEKPHCSVWQFTPKEIAQSRGIQFHEPHPDDEVPLVLTRWYGRRLSHSYGWNGSMFKLKRA